MYQHCVNLHLPDGSAGKTNYQTPLCLRSEYYVSSVIVHRFSIDCPSIVHRNDVESMVKQCRKHDYNMKEEQRLGEGRVEEQRTKTERNQIERKTANNN